MTGSRVSLSVSSRVNGCNGRGNNRGLKLTEQVMKVLDGIVGGLIRQLVSIDNSQFDFIPGRGTTDQCKLCRQTPERKVSSCQEETLLGLHRP